MINQKPLCTIALNYLNETSIKSIVMRPFSLEIYMYFKNKDCCEIYIYHQETREVLILKETFFEIINSYLEMDDYIFKTREFY